MSDLRNDGDLITIIDDDGQEFELEYIDEIDYNGSTYIAFLPANMDENDPDYGCMQKLTPFQIGGETRYLWCNVYRSRCFFNDEYTGMHKVGLNGSRMTMEQVAAQAIAGARLSNSNMNSFAKYATAPAPRDYNSHELSIDFEQFMQRRR